MAAQATTRRPMVGAGGAAPPMFQGSLAGIGAGGAAPPVPSLPPPVIANQAPWAPPANPTAGGVSVGQFTQRAPTPTPYGDFAGLDPATFAGSPGQAALLDRSQKAIQRSAAAHGSLLTGNTLDALQQNAIGLAAQDYGNEFNRRLQSYETNRGTNAQNFGQNMANFEGGLNAFRANTDATLGAGRLNADTTFGNYDRAYRAAGDTTANMQSQMDRNAAQNTMAQQGLQQGANDAYLAALASSRAQNAAQAAVRPAPAPRISFLPSVKTMGGRR